jgi:hypothetical protein
MWHASGTAGGDERGSDLRRGDQLDRTARPVRGDHLPRWQVLVGRAAALK